MRSPMETYIDPFPQKQGEGKRATINFCNFSIPCARSGVQISRRSGAESEEKMAEKPVVTNAMRLLRLPEEIIHMVSGGKLSAGHARTLLAFESEDDQLQAAQLAVKQGLSVRELEKLAKKANAVLHGGDERAKRVKKRPVFIEEVELSLNEHLGRKVKIQEKGKEKGVLTIEFYSQEDLQNLARLLGGEE